MAQFAEPAAERDQLRIRQMLPANDDDEPGIERLLNLRDSVQTQRFGKIKIEEFDTDARGICLGKLHGWSCIRHASRA